MEKELKIVKKEKDETQAKLTEANELLAANERELKNAVHATLCANPPQAAVVEGASPLMKNLSKFLQAFKNLGCEADMWNLQPAVAQLITKDLKVEIHGKHINWTDDAKKKGLPSKFHTGKLVKMDDASGRYEVELDSIVWNAGTPQEKKYRDKFSAQNFRIL